MALVAACHSNGSVVEESNIDRVQAVAADRINVLTADVQGLLLERAEPQVQPRPLRAALTTHAVFLEASDRNRALLERLYRERDYEPVFVRDGQLTEAAEVVLAELVDSGAHGLFPRDYNAHLATAYRTTLEDTRTTLTSAAPFTLTAEDQRVLSDELVRDPALLDLPDAELEAHIADLLFPASPEEARVPRAWEAYAAYIDAHRHHADATTGLELALADGFLRYAYDMRFFNPVWPVWLDEAAADDSALHEQGAREAMVQAFNRGAGAEGFAPVLAELWPHYEQYSRLVEAMRRYRGFIEEGGWESDLETVTLRPNASHEMVPRLRRRLHAEGYFDGDLTSLVYDDPIRDALIHYQRTHQFSDDGQLSEGLVNSLNRTAERRTRQIAVALQRWRESEIGDDAYYVFVNLSDFHTEVWREGNREMRFRTIVGSTDRVRRGGELVYARATPELHRTMRYIVFNPYWNVPQDIMIHEYDPNLEEDPFWYENHGYEVMYNEDGSRWVRQLPGPENALGHVKFLFPNPHDVYMHDTPQRRLFSRPTRAFSHGCMRIEDPMDLAYYLLDNDRGWDSTRVDRERMSGTEQWVTLRTPIPVHVEYYVARVDDDGYVHFLSDLYRRDQPRLQAHHRRQTREALLSAAEEVSASLADALSRAEEAGRQPSPTIESAALEP